MKTKLIVLLAICCQAISISLCSGSISQSGPQRPGLRIQNTDMNWEFVKDRLFDGSTGKVIKYNSDILIKVYGNPTREDSSVLAGLVNELKTIIPSKNVRYTEYRGNLVLTFKNGPDAQNMGWKEFSGIGNNFERLRSLTSRKKDKMPERVKVHFARYDTLSNDYTSIRLSFNDSLPLADRKRYIEYLVVQSLCVVNAKSYSYRAVSKKDAILGKAYWDDDPLNTQFDSKDKFLLTKLYAPDFNLQFKEYLLKSYSWLYYMNFTKKVFMQAVSISTVIIFLIIILLITYKPVFRHKFRHQFLNYLVPAFVLVASVFMIQYIYSLITSPKSYLVGSIFNVLLLAPITTIILASLYYALEKIIIRRGMSRKLKSVLKVALLMLFIMFPAYSLFGNELKLFGEFPAFVAIAFVISAGKGILLYIEYSEELLVEAKNAEISKLKELKAKAEVQSLQSRVNPHFLYNSLNAIAGLVYSNPEKTEKMALSLSDLFRYNLGRKDEQMGSIKEEIEMVRSYLEIEQIRFGDRLSFNIEVDKLIENQQIPRFIIQPLVENAIKHGISKIEEAGKVVIKVGIVDGKLFISVGDNGPAFPEGLVSGYGLQCLYDLLNLIYGDTAELSWQNLPEKLIRVIIPFKVKK